MSTISIDRYENATLSNEQKKELVERIKAYNDAKNKDKQMRAALELLEFNYTIGIRDSELSGEIETTLYDKGSFFWRYLCFT